MRLGGGSRGGAWRTGLGRGEFDEALGGGLRDGECLLWDVEDESALADVAGPFAAAAREDGREVVYFRFGGHGALLDEGVAQVVRLEASQGFEALLERVREGIEGAADGTGFVFDSLSGLAEGWASDAMVGAFWSLAAGMVARRGGVGYLGMRLDGHARYVTEGVRGLVAVAVNVYADVRRDGAVRKWLLLPVKAADREAPGLHLMRAWDGGAGLELVRQSAVLTAVSTRVLPKALHPEGYGRAVVREAEDWARAVAQGWSPDAARGEELKRELIDLVVTREPSMRALANRYLTLQDVLGIVGRRVGTGLIGGKSAGMLVARKIAETDCAALDGRLEAHDSFYVGSDVFYSFLVRNGLWEDRERQKDPLRFLDGVEEVRERVLRGKFSAYELGLFRRMLDYFGPYPIIVRSSSLLEDAFGNSFAGKYESVYCVNQGSAEVRLGEFLDAIRTVYASAMSRDALLYRDRFGLLGRDEQMALLVMRVSGEMQGDKFYPHLAGVGFSYNPFAWDAAIDPASGVLRLVYGLGTRAVDRVDDDYTRVVALNAPRRRPESGFDEIARHSQRKVDYVDLSRGGVRAGDFNQLAREAVGVPLDRFAPVTEGGYRFLTFDGVLDPDGGGLVGDLRRLLGALEKAYGRPVDIEYAINFDERGGYAINLLQCRPLQVQGSGRLELPEVDPADPRVLVAGTGAVVGRRRVAEVDWLLAVLPDIYSALPDAARHSVARAVGKVGRALGTRGEMGVAIGPGRWGTHLPSLGVPCSFSDLIHYGAICEVMAMHEFLTPDVSLGTHFFGELVESNILYFAIFPGKEGNRLDWGAFRAVPNRLAEVVPEAAGLAGGAAGRCLWLVKATDLCAEGLRLVADSERRCVTIGAE
ncbi:MAG: phosphoenolpyruvate synthase [Kiritimatiellae bacterium]|nr:phosphoenolpyruvate synthase [Kiritimatiellia bacterium]